MPVKLAVILATVEAWVLTRELCFLMWEKKGTAYKQCIGVLYFQETTEEACVIASDK